MESQFFELSWKKKIVRVIKRVEKSVVKLRFVSEGKVGLVRIM